MPPHGFLQSQPLVRVAVALIAGIALGVWAGEVPSLGAWLPLWVWLALAAACVVAAAAMRGKPSWQGLALTFGIVFAGAAMAGRSLAGSEFPFAADTPMAYEAVVVAEPQVRGKTLACDLVLSGEPIAVKATFLRDTIAGDWRRLRLGSRVAACSVMRQLRDFRAGSHFNYTRWLRCNGFRARTFIGIGDWELLPASTDALPWRWRLRLRALLLRQRLVERLATGGEKVPGRSSVAIGTEDQTAAVVAAMVLGDKHALSKETKEEYSVSGASHVLALSGLHLGVIYGVLMLLFGSGKMTSRRRWISQSLILAAIWTYVVLVGMGASVVRSAVMLSVYSLCLVAGRDRVSVNVLAAAAVAMLVANPLCLWDIGFQMSFMAVLSIVVFYGPVYHVLPQSVSRVPVMGYILKYVWGATVVSLVAQLGTAPLVACYFGRFSCYFLLANYIVIPCASVIIYGALAVLLASPLPVASAFLAKSLALVALGLNEAVGWVASLPGASVDNLSVSPAQVVCIYAIIAFAAVVVTHLHRVWAMRKLGDDIRNI